MDTWLPILVFILVRVLTERVIMKASYHNAHTINCNVGVNSCSFRWDTLMRGGQNIVFFGPIPQYWAQYWVPPPDPIPNTILGFLIYWSLLLLFVLLQYRLHCVTRSYVPWGHLKCEVVRKNIGFLMPVWTLRARKVDLSFSLWHT